MSLDNSSFIYQVPDAVFPFRESIDGLRQFKNVIYSKCVVNYQWTYRNIYIYVDATIV